MKQRKDGLAWLRAAAAAQQRAEVERLEHRVAALSDQLSKKAAHGSDEYLMTSKELAPYLGVTHHKTVERWVREKGLPCVRTGRNLRFRLGDVRRWQAQQGES